MALNRRPDGFQYTDEDEGDEGEPDEEKNEDVADLTREKRFDFACDG